MLTLYQFECSHYCEKARWALDYKGLDYRTRNLVPGPHRLLTERLAPRSHVPILVDGERVVQGSSEIIDYLDKRYPGARLTPVGASAAQEAHEWERYLDREIGVAIRCWFYFHALPERKLATRFLLQGAPWYGAPLYALIFPVVRRAMRSLMRIDAENAAHSESQLRAALEHLNEALRGRRYLAGSGGFPGPISPPVPCWRRCVSPTRPMRGISQRPWWRFAPSMRPILSSVGCSRPTAVIATATFDVGCER